jgi:N-acetyl-anhydromuramyl-L-alanine amidase AmpD
MPTARRARLRIVAMLCVLAAALCGAAPVGAAGALQGTGTPLAGARDRQAVFTAAAREFGVPEEVLLAVSYNLSRWENHGGAPSFAGGYGPMHLTHLDSVPNQNGKGDDVAPAPRDTRSVASLHTLDAAAALLGLSPDVLRGDPAQNIRGGAALLAQYARAATGALPAGAADWYSAVMRYSQASEIRTAARFADAVYATIQHGAARTTDDGQAIVLRASAVVPNKPASVLALSATTTPCIEAPSDATVSCEYIPAAYALNNPNDLTNYGNYDLANRPADGLAVRYIVIHDVEGSYDSAIQTFQDSTNGVSAHYVVRSSDGHIAQMVDTKNIAWHAGNWYVNGHAIGIEHEGFAIAGATWYTESMYQASAALVRYLAAMYAIPLDRAHIVGHDDVPGPTSSYQSGMHWDPGPFWDWAHYMDLLQAPSGGANANIVTLHVSPSSNVQTVKDCAAAGTPTITQGANFVYLHTAASDTAPYITNPYISSDPLCASNWGDKAVSGQTFYRFDTSIPDWDGIYFGGQQAWFHNPGHTTYTVGGAGILVKPKGRSAISVYGRAYPERSAYPRSVPVQTISAISNYKIPVGQMYVAFGPFKSDYYYAPVYTPTLAGSANQDIQGQTQYYQIFFNHRFVFVQAGDVAVVP